MALHYVAPASKVLPYLVGNLAFAAIAAQAANSYYGTAVSMTKEWQELSLDQMAAKDMEGSDKKAIVNPFRHM